jgi:hypothetical protein
MSKLIKTRASELSEGIFHNNPKIRKLSEKSDEYLDEIETLIPEDKMKQYFRLIERYHMTVERMQWAMERLMYTHGLRDGYELIKALERIKE